MPVVVECFTLGNVVYPGQHGGAEAAPAVRRLREASDGGGGPVAETQPRGGRHQRPRGEGQTGQNTFKPLRQGCIKFPQLDILPHPNFLLMIFFPKNSVPFPCLIFFPTATLL